MDPVSRSLIRPECFVLPPYVIADHGICRIQNILAGSVVLLQLDHMRIREY